MQQVVNKQNEKKKSELFKQISKTNHMKKISVPRPPPTK